MDKLESLGQQISQVTLYDIKSYYNQAKNIILNVGEMEAKVLEATNDEPWGASSTLMNEISQGTFNFQNFNEVMPAIYSRFMEKEARQWRQIYKALQLLEYLIKNGSERTVDDARSHVGTIKMLRNFQYIDEKGKDQGINVRNRAREIVELLSDLERVRNERRKAKANRNKYTGTGNDGMSFSSGGGGGRYGGFGSDSLYSGGGGGGGDYGGSSSYGNGGSGSGSGSGSRGFRDASTTQYAEYDAGDDEDLPRRSSTSISTPTSARHTARQNSTSTRRTSGNPAPPPKSKAPVQEVDLLGGLGEEEVIPSNTDKALPPTSPLSPTSAGGAGNVMDSFDDFGDFEGAPAPVNSAPAPAVAVPAIQPTQMQAQAQAQGAGGKGLFDLLGQNGSAANTMGMGHARQLSGAGAGMPMGAQMGMGMGGGMMAPSAFNNTGMVNAPQRTSSHRSTGSMGSGMLSPSLQPTPSSATSATSPKPSTTTGKSGGGFEDLWSMSLSSAGGSQKKSTSAARGGKSMQELEKEKALKGLWGAPPSGEAVKSAAPPSNGGFGNFSSGGGDDNLLL